MGVALALVATPTPSGSQLTAPTATPSPAEQTNSGCASLADKFKPSCALTSVKDGLEHKATDLAGGAVQTVASGAWDLIVQQFDSAATSMIGGLADAWPKLSQVGFDKAGVDGVYTISTALGALVAVFVLLISIVRTQLAADGRYVSAALAGLAKAAVAIAVTEVVVQYGAQASAEICQFIVNQTNGDTDAFLAQVKQIAILQQNDALTMIFALVAIVTVIVLWAELLLVKLAIAVLVATAPIGASGLLSDRTSVWWQRQAMATFRLLLVPPSITLCFALGFKEAAAAAQQKDVTGYIVALMTLAAAVLCWPALARFFAFDSDGQASGGLGLVIGAASGLGSRSARMGSGSAGNPLDPVALQRMTGAGAQAGGAGAVGAATGGLAFLPMAATAAVSAVGGFQRGLGRTASHAGLGGIGESADAPWLRGGRGRQPSGASGASAPYPPATPELPPAAAPDRPTPGSPTPDPPVNQPPGSRAAGRPIAVSPPAEPRRPRPAPSQANGNQTGRERP